MNVAPFFERPLPIALILGVFALCALPLVALQIVPNFAVFVPHLTLFVAVGLGTSHFFLTLAVYLSAEHRAYFSSSRQRQLVYFGLPALILLSLAWIEAAQLRDSHAGAVTMFFAGVRFIDFLHVGRQSYGMLQLLKRPPQGHAPAHADWLKPAENLLFVGLAVLQWLTFRAGGQWSAERSQALLPALVLGALALTIASQHALALVRGHARAWVPALYFLIQAACSAAAAYRTSLYIAVLAVHYLEYHVIMYPRCVAPRTLAAGSERLRAARPLVVYALLAIVVIAFEVRNTFAVGSFELRFLIHIFDGIFLLHYTLDAFLWRFGQPFYREQLGPLYFQPLPAAPRAPGSRRRSWLLGGALLAALAGFGVVSGVAQRIQRNLIDPLYVDNHSRWGYELALRGDLAQAKRHLQEALRHDPNSEYAKTALRWVQSRPERARDAAP
jgi:hypothetical protein